MIVNLRLQNFRSYADASFEFGDRVNIIIGPNASGKTNLLEAIQVLSTGGSYRVSDDELVSFSAPWLRLDALMDDSSARTLKLVREPRTAKTYEIDDKKFNRLTQKHKLPTVLFEPNHLQLLHGSPDFRRVYLDDLIEHMDERYSVMRKNYRRLVSQRNALLKRGRVSSAELFPWNVRMSELGAYIARSRWELAERLSVRASKLYKILSGGEAEVTMTYCHQFPLESYETQLLNKLETSLERDLARGFTTYGPHREDLSASLDGKPVCETASRGETRSIILAFKIIELEILEEVYGRPPILLLDDVFSELDGARRRALTTYLQRHQTFLTTTDADVVIKHFTDSTIIPLG